MFFIALVVGIMWVLKVQPFIIGVVSMIMTFNLSLSRLDDYLNHQSYPSWFDIEIERLISFLAHLILPTSPETRSQILRRLFAKFGNALLETPDEQYRRLFPNYWER